MNDSLSWYDFEPATSVRYGKFRNRRIPDHVKFLRIGFAEYQQLLDGATATETSIVAEKFSAVGHPNLKQVQIYLPAVSRIGHSAFRQCLELEQVEFLMKPPRQKEEEEQEEDEENKSPPSKLVSFGEGAFYLCENLLSVIGLEHAAESLQDIGDIALQCCYSLASMDFLSSMTCLQSLGRGAFSRSIITTVDLSNAVQLKELQIYTFNCCFDLISVHLPPNLLRIQHHAFSGCFALENINLPPQLEIIGHDVFSQCRQLKSFVLPSSLQRIGRRCFWECDKLSNVVLPSPRLAFLKNQPFNESCKSLSSLELPNPVPRQQWPLILLEQFYSENGIETAKNRNTIVWNFLCRNMVQLFIEP